MPTTRRHVRRTPQHGLTAAERHLLLTGECTPPRGCWSDYGEKVFRTFRLVSPGGRDDLRELWERHKDELLAEWKREGRRDRPWAAKEFGA